MLDSVLLRNNLTWVSKKLACKGFTLDVNEFLEQEKTRKILQKKIETLQASRRSVAKVIGITKTKGIDIEQLLHKAYLLEKKLTSIMLTNKILQKKIQKYKLSFPNIPDDTVPDGFTDQDNIEIMRWGNPLNRRDFSLQSHVMLGKLLNGFDSVNAVKLSGSRFVIMKGKIAQLHRALSQFMIDLHTKKHGYEEYYLPYLVNQKSLYGSGQLPKFYKDLFHIQSTTFKGDHIYTLIPTAEVPLINIMRNTVVGAETLPIKMVAHTPCFRAEAGTYGHYSHGLIRNHQFDKVELIQIVHPDQSMKVLEEITGHAEKVLQLLELPYRKVLLCAGNIGFASCKTYDLEVWIPSHNSYCEISSCSNVGDFQARRIKARYREKFFKKPKLLHTLNASGVAVGRALAAVLENYQLKDGRVLVPVALRSYMGGLTHID